MEFLNASVMSEVDVLSQPPGCSAELSQRPVLQLLDLGTSCHRVSGVLQRVMLLLRSAQWYISHLRRSRHRLHKIRQSPAYDGEVTAACDEALHWACRFLPFSRFLNAEEILQDTLLNLVSDLPLVNLTSSHI
ncbi:hypothetical protein J4Q44_G00068850 [Coregonus suidteri]|uniref:Uncharacterized protein n=1 Tax=Coregonus suidteri TaxID=861788 RepID=A0AAN8M030_9TELE